MPVDDGTGGTRVGNGLLSPPSVPERYQAPLSIGAVIDGKYRLERLLGEGGMGAVWRAQHLQLDLPVAIKLLRAGSDQGTLSERLKIEARAAAQLAHPAIVRVFDVDTTAAGEPYIVMELLGGESLSDMLDRGRLSPVSAVQLLLPIAEGLALAHGKGIVHRDLKPHNVFIVDDGDRLQPKLLDFGIAKLTLAPLDGSLTDTGIPIGSPDYMSPEQARGSKDIDYRADIWAFCVVLYEAVRGDVPFHGDNYNALMREIVESEPAPLPIAGELDQRLADLIYWGLSKERGERPESIQELGRELARWLLDRGVKEDVCGTPLGPKWITRTVQKSLPIILPNESERPPAPTHTETLLSPRMPVAASARPRPKAASPIVASQGSAARARALRLGLIGAAVLLAGGGLLWALTGRPEQVAPAGLVPAVESGAAPLETDTTPVLIAPSPPLASAIVVAEPATDEPVERDNSVPNAASSASAAKKPPARSVSEVPKPRPAAKPATDGHDEASELLQAY